MVEDSFSLGQGGQQLCKPFLIANRYPMGRRNGAGLERKLTRADIERRWPQTGALWVNLSLSWANSNRPNGGDWWAKLRDSLAPEV